MFDKLLKKASSKDFWISILLMGYIVCVLRLAVVAIFIHYGILTFGAYMIISLFALAFWIAGFFSIYKD